MTWGRQKKSAWDLLEKLGLNRRREHTEEERSRIRKKLRTAYELDPNEYPDYDKRGLSAVGSLTDLDLDLEAGKANSQDGRHKTDRAAKDEAQQLAAALWKKPDWSHLRKTAMAREIQDHINVMFNTDYDIETIADWISPIAPPHAKRAGRPRKK